MSEKDSSSEWQLVSEDNDALESTDDSSSVHSESSIEIISLETDDLSVDSDISYPSAQFSGSGTGSFFILRLPSSEGDIATESDESDEVSRNGGLTNRVKVNRKRNCTLTNSIITSDSLSSEQSYSGDLETDDISVISSDDSAKVSENWKRYEKQDICGDVMETYIPSPATSEERVDDPVTEIGKGEEEIDSSAEESLQNFLVVNVVENEIEPVVVGLNQIPVELGMNENDNKLPTDIDDDSPSVDEALHIEDFQSIVSQHEDAQNVDQCMFLGVPQDDPDTESAPEIDDEDDRIESDQGDGSSQHSDDNSALSNVDIGDLMDDPNLIRQYVHKPNPRLNVTLNTIVILVVAIAIGLGLGHAVGSRRGKLNNVFLKGCVDEYRKLFKGCYANLREAGDKMKENKILIEDNKRLKLEIQEQRSEVMKLTTKAPSDTDNADTNKLRTEIHDLRSEVTRLTAQAQSLHILKLQKSNQMMKEENNKYQNEIYDLRSEVARLRYKEIPKPVVFKQHRSPEEPASNFLLKNKVNMLEVQNQDLIREIGNLRYGPHPGNNVIDTDESAGKEKEMKENDEKVKKLKEELLVEQGRSNIWQDLYLKLKNQQRENTSDNSTHDFISCFSLLLRNVSTEDLSQVFEREWTDLKKMSIEKFKFLYDSIVGNNDKSEAKSKEDKQHAEESSTDRTQHRDKNRNEENPKQEKDKRWQNWRDKMKDVFNKTKISMSDVTEQIQATWKQVKNLSDDLWKKHEPTVSQIQKQVQETIIHAANILKEKVEEKSSKWFGRRKKKDKHDHHNFHGNQDEKKYQKEERNHGDKKPYSFKASTSRRGFGKEKIVKKCEKGIEVLNRIKKKISKLSGCKYCQMDFKEKEHFFDGLESFQEKCGTDLDFLSKHELWWYNCQWDWWWKSISFHLSDALKVEPYCQDYFSPWQQEFVEVNSWSCSHISCKKHESRHKKNKEKHRHHKKFKNRWDDDEKESVNLPKSTFHGKSADAHEDRSGIRKSEYFEDDEVLHLPKGSFHGKSTDQSDTETKPSNGSLRGSTTSCDPETQECTTQQARSWYMDQMKHRQDERHSEDMEDSKTKWMFERARNRRNQRINSHPSESNFHKSDDVRLFG